MTTFRRIGTAILLSTIVASTNVVVGDSNVASAIQFEKLRPQTTAKLATALRNFAVDHPTSPKPLSVAQNRILERVSQPTSTPLATTFCLRNSYVDKLGDGGSLDASTFTFAYDCTARTWYFTATDPSGVSAATFEETTMWVNRDQNGATGCHGAEIALAAFADTVGSIRTMAISVPTCNTSSWTFLNAAVLGGIINSTTVGLIFGDYVIGTPTFQWFAWLVDTNGRVDNLPDNPWIRTSTPSSVPGMPRSLWATSGNGRISVAFKPAADDNSTVDRYTSECQPISTGTAHTGSRTTSPITVLRLTNGVQYHCRVKAHNVAGTGPWSAWTKATMPIGPPQPPTIDAVAVGNNRVSVSFTPPQGAVNGRLASFRAVCVSGSGTFSDRGWASPVVVTGLTNGVPHTCTVAATNQAGEGTFSSGSATFTPVVSVPDAPIAVHATTDDTTATVTFAPPESDGGSAITNYTVIALPSGTAVNVASSPATFTGLSYGTKSRYNVYATNAIGDGDASTLSNIAIPLDNSSQGTASFRRGPDHDFGVTQTPIVGDYNGDRRSDVLGYAAGPYLDQVRLGTANAGFVFGDAIHIVGSYQPIVGDFNGDGRSDVLWYAPGDGADPRWSGTATGGFTGGAAMSIDGTYQPIAGDFDGNGYTDILWDSPSGTDRLWLGSVNGFNSGPPATSTGAHTGVPADFNSDGYTDILWYVPGGGIDLLWISDGDGTFTVDTSISINGTYQLLPGDYNADGYTDVMFYAPGGATDRLWIGKASGGFNQTARTINGIYNPLNGDFNGDGRTDIFWYARGLGTDPLWLGN